MVVDLFTEIVQCPSTGKQMDWDTFRQWDTTHPEKVTDLICTRLQVQFRHTVLKKKEPRLKRLYFPIAFWEGTPRGLETD